MGLFISFLALLKQHFLKSQKVKRKRVSYYPPFLKREDLSNHFYRSLWYLPFHKKHLHEVLFYSPFQKKEDLIKPDFFYREKLSSKHVQILRNPFRYLKKLLLSDVILVWKQPGKFITQMCEKLDITLKHVETNNPKSIEYGTYPGLFWYCLLTKKERNELYKNYQKKFSKVHESISKENIEKVYVFGNGPSIQEYKKHNYTKALSIICNSAVQNEDLLKTTQPRFVTAGDAISHIGVSAYAEKFRLDLFRYISKNECYFFGTLELFYFITIHYPSLESKYLLCLQNKKDPTLNLKKNYFLPRLASTMNIHMLPLASTFSQKILLLGVDGKSETEEKNEDFWPHAAGFQYHKLVDSGHLSHPTFQGNRAVGEYKRYINSIETSFREGEKKNKNQYIPLADSNIAPIQKRRTEYLKEK